MAELEGQNVANAGGSYLVGIFRTAGPGRKQLQAFVLTDSDGNEYNTGNPLPVDATFTGSVNTSPVPCATSSETVVAVADSSTSILAANADRKAGWIKNISSVDIYVSLSGTAATNKPTLITSGASLSLGGTGYVYTGEVSAIHADTGQSHNVEVVELEE